VDVFWQSEPIVDGQYNDLCVPVERVLAQLRLCLRKRHPASYFAAVFQKNKTRSWCKVEPEQLLQNCVLERSRKEMFIVKPVLLVHLLSGFGS